MPEVRVGDARHAIRIDSPYNVQLTDAVHDIDVEHPWLGLDSFREATSAYFFGREYQIGELHLRLRGHPLLVLYGKSGLGKTSIVQAGLLPRLRRDQGRPVVMRLRFDDPHFDAGEQLAQAVLDPHGPAAVHPGPLSRPSHPWCQRLGATLGLQLPEDHASQLWLRLHSRDEPPEITHLILDQFEEVFTLARPDPALEAGVRDALAILVHRAMPASIARLLSEHDALLDRFDPDSMPVRVVLSLRDDYVYALNRWRRHIPVLGQNNFELRALRGRAALDAVFKPGELRSRYQKDATEANLIATGLPPIITKGSAERIVRFVGRKPADAPIEDIEAVPPIISLLCRELNERRFSSPNGTPDHPAAQITFDEADADIGSIITAFYDRCLADRPEAVRIFVEEEFVSYAGARLPQDERSILDVFENGCEIPGAPAARRALGYGDRNKALACLSALVNDRLLSPLGDGRYELIHDLLASVVEKSRTLRAQRLAKEEADRTTSQEREAREAAQRQVRRTWYLLLSVAAALGIALIAYGWGVLQYRRAETARDEAEKLLAYMAFDLNNQLKALGRLNILDDVNRRIEAYYASVEHETVAPEDQSAVSQWLRSLMLRNRGDILEARGDLTDAFSAYNESAAIAERLIRQDPANPTWQSNLAMSYDRIGEVQKGQGNYREALSSFSSSLAINQKLIAGESQDIDFQNALSNSYLYVCDVRAALDELPAANESCRRGFDIARKLAAESPHNIRLQENLSTAYLQTGIVQEAEALKIKEPKLQEGALARALEAYREAVAINQRLVERDAGNARWHRNLATSYENLGDVLYHLGQFLEARQNFAASLALTEALARQDPDNVRWQEELSLSYLRLASVVTALGETGNGTANYRRSVAIAQGLAKKDATNARWQANLAFVYLQAGSALAAGGEESKAEGRLMLESGRDILRELSQRTGLTAPQKDYLETIERTLQQRR